MTKSAKRDLINALKYGSTSVRYGSFFFFFFFLEVISELAHNVQMTLNPDGMIILKVRSLQIRQKFRQRLCRASEGPCDNNM